MWNVQRITNKIPEVNMGKTSALFLPRQERESNDTFGDCAITEVELR